MGRTEGKASQHSIVSTSIRFWLPWTVERRDREAVAQRDGSRHILMHLPSDGSSLLEICSFICCLGQNEVETGQRLKEDEDQQEGGTVCTAILRLFAFLWNGSLVLAFIRLWL